MRIVSLDIGGTSIKSGIWSGDGAEEVKEWETNAHKGGSYVIERAKQIIRTYEGFSSIGISTAGQVNSAEGYIRYANENIPGYTGMQIKQILETEFGVPAAVENDVNAAAVGEGHFGAGKCFDDFLCITYGTGVGGAVVINKKVYTGSLYSAGEFGGIIVHPEDVAEGAPFSGCYENYASTTALVRQARAYDPNLSSGREIFKRLHESQVRMLVDNWIDEIVWGLVTVIHIFNPSCIVLGGGVMAQPYILEEVKKKTLSRVMSSFANVKLTKAKLGNHAGLLGAAYLAKEHQSGCVG